jgi:acyl-CoA thioesterase
MEAIKQFFSDNDLFARHNGIEIVEVGEGEALVSMKIEPYHFNGAATVHGGAIFTLADFAFAIASNSHGQLAMGISTSMNFVKAPVSGTLYARAAEQSRNAKLASYSVIVTDDEGCTVALFQGMVYRKKKSIIPAAVDNESNIG